MSNVLDFVVEKGSENIRLDHFLVSHAEHNLSRSYIKKLISDNKILVNNRSVKVSCKLKTGDHITLELPKPKKLEIKPQDIPLDIIYEDKDLIVINKSAGMVAHPAPGHYEGTLVNALMHHCKDLSGIGGVERPGIVHRLDKDTSGLMVVAKSDPAHRTLSKNIKDRKVVRKYLALVHGWLKKDRGLVSAKIGRNPVNRQKMAIIHQPGLKSREAVTEYKVIKRYKKTTLVELTLQTGRTHQIRVHMSHIGHPVVGDQTYGKKKDACGLKRQFLHAYKLEFSHPIKKKDLKFEIDLPGELALVLENA